jgi:hypothetical protein
LGDFIYKACLSLVAASGLLRLVEPEQTAARDGDPL